MRIGVLDGGVYKGGTMHIPHLKKKPGDHCQALNQAWLILFSPGHRCLLRFSYHSARLGGVLSANHCTIFSIPVFKSTKLFHPSTRWAFDVSEKLRCTSPRRGEP